MARWPLKMRLARWRSERRKLAHLRNLPTKTSKTESSLYMDSALASNNYAKADSDTTLNTPSVKYTRTDCQTLGKASNTRLTLPTALVLNMPSAKYAKRQKRQGPNTPSVQYAKADSAVCLIS